MMVIGESGLMKNPLFGYANPVRREWFYQKTLGSEDLEPFGMKHVAVQFLFLVLGITAALVAFGCERRKGKEIK